MDEPKSNFTDYSAATPAAIVLIAGSLVATFAILHHPTIESHQFEDLVKEIQSEQTVNAAVHGVMIVLLGLFSFGMQALSIVLGTTRPTVILAQIAYGIGAICMMVAATVSGFITVEYLRHVSAEPNGLEISRQVVSLLHVVNEIFALMGIVGMSIGVLGWSLAAFAHGKTWRVSGCIGFVAASSGLAGVSTEFIQASVIGMTVFVVTHGTWNIAAAVNLLSLSDARVENGVDEYESMNAD